MSEAACLLDDRMCQEVLAEVGAERPDLATILEAALNASPADADDIATLLRPEDKQWALGIVARVWSRHGKATA